MRRHRRRRNRLVRRQAPAQHDTRAERAGRQPRNRRHVAAARADPGMTSSDRTQLSGRDRRGVAADHERSTGTEEVLERAACDRDFEHAAVETCFGLVHVPERERRIGGVGERRRRVEMAVADRVDVRGECGIRHRQRMARIAVPAAAGAVRGRRPAGRQRRSGRSVEILRTELHERTVRERAGGASRGPLLQANHDVSPGRPSYDILRAATPRQSHAAGSRPPALAPEIMAARAQRSRASFLETPSFSP